MKGQRSLFLYGAMAFGYAFLYLPIVSVIVFSFNRSKAVTVWGGFSTQWYSALFHNELVLQAAGRSLAIGSIAASAAVVIGTAAALALSRFGRFHGRSLLSLATSAPLVIPDVMLGLSSLLLFITLRQVVGWPDPNNPGISTVVVAHITFCTSYVTVVVRSRLTQMDMSLEEAALDLGARPWKVFFVVTLPLIAPALISGWLLAFTLSLDDLVVASFTAQPGASTLPMLIYSKVKFSVTPEINALATLIVLFVTAAVVLTGWLMRERGEPGKQSGR